MMKIISFVLFILHSLILLILFATKLNQYTAPSTAGFLNITSLMFPLLMVINLILIVYWIISWKKRAFIFILLSFFLYPELSSWVNWNQQEKGNLKILSFNIHSGTFGKEKLLDFIHKTNADIVILQEHDGSFDFDKKIYRNKESAIVTDYEVLQTVGLPDIDLDSTSLGQNFYADIKIKGKIYRIFDLHLQSYELQKDMVKPSKNIDVNKNKFETLLQHLIPTFKIHEEQIKVITQAIDNSPYPVLVAGDFNSVPNSWEYYQLKSRLQDAFIKAGRGSSTSFHDYKYPIRIDFMLISKEIKPKSYKVYREEKFSDHFPVIAEFEIPTDD